MNNAPLDVLLQLPVPRSESAPNVTRPRDASSGFDNHFRKASDTGAAPSAFTPPPAETETNESQRRSRRSENRATAADERPPQAAAATDSASDAADATDQQDAEAVEKQADSEKSQDYEYAAIVATITATEERAKAAVAVPEQNDAAKLEGKQFDTGSTATEAPQDPKNTKQTAEPSDVETKPVPIEAHDAGSDVPGDKARIAAEQGDIAETASGAKAAHDTPDIAAKPAAEIAGDPPAADKDTKSARHGIEHEPGAAAAAAKELSPTQSEGATQEIDKNVSQPATRLDPAADGSPKKADKKSNGRAPTTTVEAASAPTERPVAIARTADAAATAPAAANVQQQLSTAGTTTASTTDSTAKPKDAAITAKQGLLSPFARLERGAHAARGSHRTGQTEGAPHVDPARFVSRVARAIHTAQERGAPLQLRLSPPDLGAMRLELSVNQGALTATIETESSNTRQLLLDNLPALRERLAEQNVKIERFDVDVRRDSTGSQQNPAAQDRGNAEHHQRGSGRHAGQRANAAPPSLDEAQPIRRSITNTTINVVA